MVQTDYQQYTVFAFFLKKYFETTFDTHTHTYNSVVITDKHNFSETRQKVQNLKNIKKYGSIS